MAFKQFTLDEQTLLRIYKRRTSRSVRMTVAPSGEVRVSIPSWAPYRVGIEFAKSRRAWIDKQRRPRNHLVDGQAIGKAHRLRLEPSTTAVTVTTRLKQNEAVVTYPEAFTASDTLVQAAAQKVGIRALRREAETLLPQRLQNLASRHNFEYRAVTIKQLKGRWGSCDQHRNIVLNLYLMQLPWECIDYVLLHELTHTRIMRHGPDFWRAMESVLPDVKRVRKLMREHQPVLNSPLLAQDSVA